MLCIIRIVVVGLRRVALAGLSHSVCVRRGWVVEAVVIVGARAMSRFHCCGSACSSIVEVVVASSHSCVVLVVVECRILCLHVRIAVE